MVRKTVIGIVGYSAFMVMCCARGISVDGFTGYFYVCAGCMRDIRLCGGCVVCVVLAYECNSFLASYPSE